MKKTNSRVNPILFQTDMEDLLRQAVPELNLMDKYPKNAYVFMSSSEIENQIVYDYDYDCKNPGVSFKWVLATIPKSKRSIIFSEVLNSIGKLASGAFNNISGEANSKALDAIKKLQALEDGIDLGSKLKDIISGNASNKIMGTLNKAWQAGSFKEFEKTGHAYHLALDPEFYKLGGFANIMPNDDGLLKFTIGGFYREAALYNAMVGHSERKQDNIGFYNEILAHGDRTTKYVYDYDNKEWILT